MYAIELENVTKKFILRGVNNLYFGDEIFALKDINIKIKSSQIVGLIGRNGSGKTTLLNIIAGIMSPTKGIVKINGKISCLISLGVGFQNELTGRENIYLNASFLGMSNKEIKSKFNDIVKFSELNSFLDFPLQSYSQGMKMRLGFAIAINVDFDILLLDEIISVGDYSFQKKCFEKIEEFKKKGKTMIIASQSMDIIERLCDRVILLEKGQIIKDAEPKEAIENYLKILSEKRFSELYPRRISLEGVTWWAKKEEWGKRMGSKGAEITDVKILNIWNKETNEFEVDDSMKVKVDFVVNRKIYEPHFGIAIFREDGVYCYGPNTYFDGYRFNEIKEGKGFFTIKYKKLNLMPGDYRLSIGIWDKLEHYPFDYLPGSYKFKIIGKQKNTALLKLDYIWKDRPSSDNEIDSTIETSLILNIDKYWGDCFDTEDVLIRRINILDKKYLIKDSFSHNEKIIIEVELEYKENKIDDSTFIWIGIFREDKIYCHGVIRKLLNGQREVVLIYPKINLLTGRYYVSSCIFKTPNELLAYSHGIHYFDIFSPLRDHGTIYIEHEWGWRFSDGKV